jgi:hypothetical protein
LFWYYSWYSVFWREATSYGRRRRTRLLGLYTIQVAYMSQCNKQRSQHRKFDKTDIHWRLVYRGAKKKE